MNNYNDVITLIDTVVTPTAETTVRTEVFAAVASVGYNEFYQATQNGFQPEIKFILADYLDYDDQGEVEWNSKVYRVIRTYRTNSQELELTCERVNA